MGYLKKMIAKLIVEIRTVELEVELQELKADEDGSNGEWITMVERKLSNLHKYIEQN